MSASKGNTSMSVKNIKDKIFGQTNFFRDGIDIQIISDRDIFLDGCYGIETFEEDRIVLLGKGIRVKIDGANFEIFTFADGRIKASGKIQNISLEREA